MNWNGVFSLTCRNKLTGENKWSDIVHNALTDEGEHNILDAYLRNSNIPASFYIGLTSMSSIDESTTLLNLTDEVTAVEYYRQLVERTVIGWPQLQLDAFDNNYQVISKVVSFEASSSWSMADKLFMCTSSDNSGLLISFGNLSVERNLVENDILDVVYKIKLA